MKNLDREKIKETIVKAVEDALNRTEVQYDSMSEKTAEAIGSLRERASVVYGDMKGRAADTKVRVDKYVREQPGKSLLVSAGAGVLAALVVSAFMRKRKGCR